MSNSGLGIVQERSRRAIIITSQGLSIYISEHDKLVIAIVNMNCLEENSSAQLASSVLSIAK